MAITKAIPKIWSARIIEGFQRSNVWINASQDVSGELADGGNELSLTSITSSVTVGDYARNTDINDPEILTDDDDVLAIDQQKYFNIAIDDVDRVQAKPELLSHFTLMAGREVAKVADDFMRGVWIPSDLPSGRQSTIAKASLATDANDAKIELLIDALNLMVESCDNENWPEDGRRMIITNRTATLIRKYLIDRGVIGTGQANETALVSAAINRLFGMSVTTDKNIAAPASAGDLVAAVMHNSGVLYAGQIRTIEPYRLEKRFSDAVKGLYVYGAKKINNNAIRTLEQAA